jgi:HlyD family secretion protein
MKKRILIIAFSIVVLAVAAYEVILHLKTTSNYLTVSGRVEADETQLSPMIQGRLTRVLIDDGTEVKKGDTVAVIEDDELKSKKREVIEKIKEVSDNVNAAEIDLDYTTRDVFHGVDEARKGLSIAEAKLRQAEARRQNAEKELTRYSRLREKEAVSEQKLDNTSLAAELAREEVSTASQEVGRAKVSLAKAEDSKELVKAKEKQLLALKKSLSQLKETLNQVEINIGYTKVIAPEDGVILRKVSEPGEVLPAGGVVGVMINPEDVHVKTYIPEQYVGMIRLNMQAEVFTDAYPKQPVAGYICYISDRAEFTPKEVQSYEERVKQVFAVKVCFSHGKGLSSGGKAYYEILKKGMPVDVKFSLKGKK